MLIINEQQIQQQYGMREAIRDVTAMLQAKERGQINNPHRTVLGFPERQASALYMPSADMVNKVSSVKVVTIFPENPAQGKPTTQGVILLSDGDNGEHVAMMTASYLTRLRTGALSGIATDLLARQESRVLTVIGTGGMAFEQVLGVVAVRPIEKIILVNRTPEKAHRFGERLVEFGINLPYIVETNVSSAVQQADIICCATRSNDPVFNGDDVKPGTHINGVGSYLPTMREVDETTILRADKIVADDLPGVKDEAGELIYTVETGAWSFDQLHAELGQVVVGDVAGRESQSEITFFKCVGAAYFDLAVAKGVYNKISAMGTGMEVQL
ncbi:ornithine cyclodeaminase [Planococcus kocurii]|uniref:Ornithine cyclodeaminase n=1 Tax=Planococcus kocurii TaxID=1374 RepID=A0ABM5WZ82_9BACL|nr:ornithine cyclodeaminase [Planococcus kocurii]ALS79653.1 ornithine cyclodeaminase [Planococcus kocurii]